MAQNLLTFLLLRNFLKQEIKSDPSVIQHSSIRLEAKLDAGFYSLLLKGISQYSLGFHIQQLCSKASRKISQHLSLITSRSPCTEWPDVHGWDLRCKTRGILRTVAANNSRSPPHLSASETSEFLYMKKFKKYNKICTDTLQMLGSDSVWFLQAQSPPSKEITLRKFKKSTYCDTFVRCLFLFLLSMTPHPLPPKKATLGRLSTLSWFVSYRRLTPKFQCSLTVFSLYSLWPHLSVDRTGRCDGCRSRAGTLQTAARRTGSALHTQVNRKLLPWCIF